MLSSLKALNLLVMFLLELAVYAASVYWGFTASSNWLTKVVLGVGAPVVLITVWAMFGAPHAKHHLHDGGRVVLELLWFGAGGAALAASGKQGWAWTFAGAYLLNAVLRLTWGQ